MIHIDLFSGLGLFSYAADHVWDLEHVFCEIEDWPYRFLKQEYPDARIERDIRKFDGTEYAGRTFLLSGGPPCQPASVAGKRKGTEDDRWLWQEAIRIMAETQPTWAIFENPLGILTLEKGLVFENLLLEMESQGYAVQPYIIPACAIGAVHRRDRVWIVARNTKSNSIGEKREFKKGTNSKSMRSNSNASNPQIARSGKLPESERWDNPANTNWQNKRIATDSDRFNGNNGGYGSGEIRGELRQEAEIQGCEDVANAAQQSKREQANQAKPISISGKTRNEFSNRDWQRPWPEVATELCGISFPFTDWIYRTGGRLKNAKRLLDITGQDMPYLFNHIQQEKLWLSVGNEKSILSKKDLFAVLWQYFAKSERQDDLSFESATVQNAFLRNVWHGQKTGRSLQRWEYKEQLKGKHSDTLPQLSHEVALVAKELSYRYTKDRIHRLKALGNTIQWEVAYEIMKGIKNLPSG